MFEDWSHESEELSSQESSPDLYDHLSRNIPNFGIDENKRKALCFRENLIVCIKDNVSKDTKPVGGYCISAESIGPKGRDFLVHVISSMTIDNSFGGSKMISSTNGEFHCLEEKRNEFLRKEEGLYERKLYVASQKDSFYVRVEHKCPCDSNFKLGRMENHVSDMLVSEGVNVLLMRYLALVNFDGSLSLHSISMDGVITRNDYNCVSAHLRCLDGREMEVYKIDRTVYHKDVIHNIKTYLTKQGRIVQHNWLDVPYMLRINPLINLETEDPRRFKLPSKIIWQEDMELMSKYLDRKTFQAAQHTDYLTRHPQVRQMIADYVQSLVTAKPLNVLKFTIRHFASFVGKSKLLGKSLSTENLFIHTSPYADGLTCCCDDCSFCAHTDKLRMLGHVFEKYYVWQLELPSMMGEVDRTFSKCSVCTHCSDTCEGCQRKKPCDVLKECPDCPGCRRKLEPCDILRNCVNCPGCQDKNKPCDILEHCPDCRGCRAAHEPCQVLEECPECPGCRRKLEPCDISKKCPNCPGCQDKNEPCDILEHCPDCCGCRPTFEPCDVLEDCPECHGCHPKNKPCEILDTCPECPGCQTKHESCDILKKCLECPGCKNKNEPCDILEECLECPGCQKLNEPCDILKECRKCLGCQQKCEPCLILEDCPECPGCQNKNEPCDVLEKCPECPGCQAKNESNDVLKVHSENQINRIESKPSFERRANRRKRKV